WIGCTDHLINLCANDVVRNESKVIDVLSAVRNIVIFTRQSHLANETLHKFQRSLGLIERQLIFDVITLWNSTFYMVQRFMEERICLIACMNDKVFQKHFTNAKALESIEWNNLEELINVLEPFEAATRKLSVDSSPTLSLAIPLVTTLFTSLETRSTDSVFLREIKGILRQSLDERFKDIYQNKMILLSTVLDPRWKDFNCLERLLYQKHVETLNVLNKLQAFESKTLAYVALKEQFDTLLENDSVLSQSQSSISDEAKNEPYDIFDIMITNHSLTSSNSTCSELIMYQHEREISRNDNPLKWWSENKRKYPLLSQLACKYLCISATSAPSERMFSASGYLTSDRRSRLTPESANVLLFLNKNMSKSVN
ncbi:unnamed protein product, partial [Rotaria magnacalcarata]